MAADEILERLVPLSVPSADPDLAIIGELVLGKLEPKLEHLACFWPGEWGLPDCLAAWQHVCWSQLAVHDALFHAGHESGLLFSCTLHQFAFPGLFLSCLSNRRGCLPVFRALAWPANPGNPENSGAA